MFGGNAKTHFQVLGRGDNPTGYLMSPFGDERWDIDDQEKLNKIKKKNYPDQRIPLERTVSSNQYYGTRLPDTAGMVNNYGEPHQQQQQQQQQYMYRPYESVLTNHQPQSETQVFKYQQQQQMQYPAKVYYQPQYDQSMNQHPTAVNYRYQQQNYCGDRKTSQPQVNSYQYPVPDKYGSGTLPQQPQQQQLQQQRSYQYQMHENSFSRPVKPSLKNGLQDVRNSQSKAYICDSCQVATGSKYSNRSWKSSPDVPIAITGESAYKPFGPNVATPNPFYPPKERNLYAPLH